ncbi:hypothetical protein PAHAL_8G234000 [Panicum hallii]|jgi:speckle-type POZ protein|uniref:BTB domain-containing protein n=1 Tax=Panicum hallii TaxID=206008 RepID=A0A2S3IFF9_9POAL|nr:BTB/POZ and MATH domain-containing protein 1-like [Panicum hallii]PAN43410.1 hypothetical protein PAHAL_8G234000 [Panicum hallii]
MASSSSTSAAGSGDGARETTTTSEFVATEVSGSHVLTINGYSRAKGIPTNEFISSSFTFAGHSWSIRYFPNGSSSSGGTAAAAAAAAAASASVYLACADDVVARFTICFLDEAEERPICSMSTGEFRRMSEQRGDGFQMFITRVALERWRNVRDDRLRIRCDITVLKVIQQNEHATTMAKYVDVPPPDLFRSLGYLLSTGDGADVVFEVGGETFSAHRCILAARSPVFRAELFGPMKEGAAASVGIHDMEARVFKALLDFIYTDVFPDIDEGETMAAMASHLLVAADRYGLERLKLICEEKLCGYIDTSTAGTIFALAEQHGCHGLKKACSDFLMSGNNLTAAIATGGFEHLKISWSSVLQELLVKLIVKSSS